MSEALKTVVCLLNRVPSKTVAKIPYELWTEKSPSIGITYLGLSSRSLAIYIPYEKKLDSRTFSYLFEGYSERFRDFRFYCSSTKNIKTDNANFF